jgi:cyclophilin family peptidyl-prolyl cis-trans isomerase
MTVHQTQEFHIAINVEQLTSPEHVEKVSQYCGDNGYDCFIDHGLVIETFTSEHEAINFEKKVLQILKN